MTEPLFSPRQDSRTHEREASQFQARLDGQNMATARRQHAAYQGVPASAGAIANSRTIELLAVVVDQPLRTSSLSSPVNDDAIGSGVTKLKRLSIDAGGSGVAHVRAVFMPDGRILVVGDAVATPEGATVDAELVQTIDREHEQAVNALWAEFRAASAKPEPPAAPTPAPEPPVDGEKEHRRRWDEMQRHIPEHRRMPFPGDHQ